MVDFHSPWQDIPLFNKTYELYKTFYEFLLLFPRKNRYTLGQKSETILLEILEAIILASNLPKQEKLPVLKKASMKLDILRVFFKLAKEIKALENKKYQILESQVTEIGKMLGGWIKSSQT